jgi:hypothetical protein
LSLGRYGANCPGERKVSLEITVDKWVSDALEKVRSKKSVSSLVNSLLGTVIRQFDPGPASPFIYELVRLLAKHRREAEALGDTETLASVVQLHSILEPYIDLAEAEPNLTSGGGKERHDGTRTEAPFLLQEHWSPSSGPPIPIRSRRDYHWYAVPVLCHEKPMLYLKEARTWECLICGKMIHDT